MNDYQYKPILTKDQIVKYLRWQKWTVGTFVVLFSVASITAYWSANPDGEANLLSTVSFYVALICFGIFLLVLRFIPDCSPIVAKQKPDLESWREKFDEVDQRVLTILNERDFITQYEFAEIQKSIAFLSVSEPKPLADDKKKTEEVS